MASSSSQLDDIEIDDSEIDFSDIEAKYAVRYDQGLDDVLVIDNVPIIKPEREQKLFQTIQKRFRENAGVEIPLEGFHIPYGQDGNSKGYIFVELSNANAANTAMRLMDGHPFDKKHRFSINRFTDIEKLTNMSEEYVEPKETPYEEKEHLRSWLTDPSGRDQLVLCRGEDVSIAYHNRVGPLEIAKDSSGKKVERNRWTDSYVQWSPLGTFLATLHVKGVALWGGQSWKCLNRFSHQGARVIDFSPNENYMVTWSSDPITVNNNENLGPRSFTPDDEGNRVAVWDVKTGHLLRTFPLNDGTNDQSSGPNKSSNVAGGGFVWPFLKWSNDDKYCARVVPGKAISVYELPSMEMLDKKSIKIDGVVDFEWVPMSESEHEIDEVLKKSQKLGQEALNETEKKLLQKGLKKKRENNLVFWVPEIDNQPARVTVMNVPSRNTLRSKNLFNVSSCKIHPHPQGDYVCVKVDRHTKTKKSVFSNLELFRMREKDCPVEVIELKDPVTAFAWEPLGSHFAVISSNDPALGTQAPGITIKTQLSFFELDSKKGDFRLLKTLDNKTCNTIFWSPKGRHLVAATLGSSQRFDLEFYDVDFGFDTRQGLTSNDPSEEVKLIGSGEHYGITDLEWDPSGRYLVTNASVWRHSLENGYAIWDFKGAEQQKHVIERFKQILWRPRPRTLLSKEQQRLIRKNLKEYSKTFEEQDQAEESSQALAHKEQYQRALEEWRAWRKKNKQDLENLKMELSDHQNVEDLKQEEKELNQQNKENKEEVQEWIEEVLEEVEEIVEEVQ